MSSELLATTGALGGALAVAQFVWSVYREHKGGTLHKGQAEAAKASLDAAQAEAALPHVAQSLRLGNVGEAVTVQQQVINGMRDHAAWQDAQITLRDRRIADLENRLSERDAKIDALEERLGVAEGNLAQARQIIDGLRDDPQHSPHR